MRYILLPHESPLFPRLQPPCLAACAHTHAEVEPCYWNTKAKVLKKDHHNYTGLYQLLRQQVDTLENFVQRYTQYME